MSSGVLSSPNLMPCPGNNKSVSRTKFPEQVMLHDSIAATGIDTIPIPTALGLGSSCIPASLIRTESVELKWLDEACLKLLVSVTCSADFAVDGQAVWPPNACSKSLYSAEEKTTTRSGDGCDMKSNAPVELQLAPRICSGRSELRSIEAISVPFGG